MQLHIGYSRETNNALHSFLPTVQTFQSWISAAYSSLSIYGKQSVQNVHQWQQHTIKVCCKIIMIGLNELLLRQVIPNRQQNSLSAFNSSMMVIFGVGYISW